MSQYLSICLKKKDNKDVKISLWRVSTTPARKLDGIGAFPYTEEDVLLDKKTYFEYLRYIKEELNIRYMSEMVMFDKEVHEAIKEDIFDCKSIIEVSDDDITEYNCYLNELNHIWTIYDNNSEDWDLYYFNC